MPSTSTDRLNGLSTSVAAKAPVRAVTNANITLSGLQTVGGVALAEGDRVLVKDQTSGVNNGLYEASTGDWTRAPDFDGNRDVRHGTLVVVPLSGGNAFYQVTTADPIVIGTSSIAFQRTDAAGVEAYTPLDYGATGDGSTDDYTALQAWLDAIPEDGEGFIPAATVYYKCATALTRTTRVSIRGEGLKSRIHYTGSGVALTIDDGRFSQFMNWYLSGTSAAAGGLYVKAAQEGFHTEGFVSDGFSGATAYAGRFSDCWDVLLKSGAFRQSTTGLLFDTTVVDANGVNNVVNILGVDCSATGIGVDYQAGDLCNIIGVDFTNGGGITPVAAIEVGRGLTGAKFVRMVNILGNWFEGTGAAVRVGRSNTSSATPDTVNIDGNFFGNTGDQIRLYKSQSVSIGKNLWGTGEVIIDAGVTGTRIEKRGVTITDNSTAGETRYYANDTTQVDELIAKNLIKIGSGASATRLLSGTATIDFGSIADAAATTGSVTVTGAALGDVVLGVSHSLNVTAGAILTGQVTATDTVTVTLFNKTGGALDLASGTVRAVVGRFA